MSKKRLKEVMRIQSETYGTQDMDDFIYARYEELAEQDPDNYSYVYEEGNTYITKGLAETYPCVIAHTDTVHDIHKDLTVFDDGQIMFAMDMTKGLQVGIGGDDKVGIYIALEMLREFNTIKVAFFRDEEHGCLGSREADMKWFKNVEFVLQCDRQGYKDFVNTIFGTKLYDKPFLKAIKPILTRYRKKPTSDGGLTDVYQLVENGYDGCVANISCGYYRPHCDDEIILIEEVFETRDFVWAIIDEIAGTMWVNSTYVDWRSYEDSKPKKATKKKATDWNERSKDDWWEGDRYGQGDSVWDEVAGRHGVMVHKKYRTFDDFDENDAYDHMDLELECSKCESDEIMYDRAQDADWCFACDEYTNVYSHVPTDDYDSRPTEEELHYQNPNKL